MEDDIKLSKDTQIISYRKKHHCCRYCEHCKYYVRHDGVIEYWCNLKFKFVTGLFDKFCKYYCYDMRNIS